MKTNSVTYKHLQQYLEGKLDEKTMHELEKQALNDPFLADALEGYSHSQNHAGPQLSLLQKQLEERIATQQENKDTFYFTWQRISVAAAACLLFIAASMLFWMKGSRPANTIATREKEVKVHLTHPDSLGKDRQMAKAQVSPDLQPSAPSQTSVSSQNTKTDKAGVINPELRKSPSANIYKRKYGTSGSGVVSRASGRADIQQIIRGLVVSQSGMPLKNVIVKVKGSSTSVSTGNDGRFLINDSTALAVQLSAPGYKSREVNLLPGEMLNIVLEESNNTLSELAIGSNDNHSAVQPIEGWDKYNQYLEENNRLSTSFNGMVKVSFTLSADGTPSNLKVERSLNEKADAEALRLVKEGPRWKPSGTSIGRVTVTFGNK